MGYKDKLIGYKIWYSTSFTQLVETIIRKFYENSVFFLNGNITPNIVKTVSALKCLDVKVLNASVTNRKLNDH